MANLSGRNPSSSSLMAESTTSVSDTTATAELSAPHADEIVEWDGMYSTLRDRYLQQLAASAKDDPETMQRFQSREESQKKKKSKKSNNPFRDDEGAGTVGMDNLLSEEENMWKSCFATMESRATTQKSKESMYSYYLTFGN